MLNTKLEILKYPHPILKTPSQDIDIMGPERKHYIQFISKMMEMYNGDSEWGMLVGLAAPQVGKNWNIFVALGEVYINPKVEPNIIKGFSRLKEGCYSLEKNKFDYDTKRYYEIRVTWVDINGETQSRKFRGREAQVIQHEYDHLLGKLCIDHEQEGKKRIQLWSTYRFTTRP